MIDKETGEVITEPRNELFAALAAAQGEFKPVTTDKKVDFPVSGNRRVTYNYASFAAIMEMAQKPLSKNGLSVLQYTRDGMLITTLAHESGQSISSALPLPENGDIKQLGANLSYLRRYQYTSIIGAVVRDEDDEQAVDGEAGKKQSKPSKPSKPQPTNGNGDNPVTKFFKEINQVTHGYYESPNHLYNVIGGWPNFADPDDVEARSSIAIDHASGKVDVSVDSDPE